MSKKIVFCGGGNMAEGIIRGLIKNGTAVEDIAVNEIMEKRCGYLRETYGLKATTEMPEEIKDADLVIIAVLPRFAPGVAANVKDSLKDGAIVLSIAAGVTISTLEENLGADKKVVRIMPNTLSITGNGYSAVCLNANVTAEEKEVVTEVVSALGKVMYIAEDMFNTFTAFSCSGPMWFYKMTEAMTNAGVYEGFSRPDATSMVLENMLGVAKMLQMTGDTPASKVNAMCSPGGVTIEGFKSLQEEGFDAAVMTSVNKAVNKAKSI